MIAGALEVQMFANIARISKDMNDVKGIVGNSMNSVEKSVQSAKNVIASLGAGLSVGVLAGKFKQVAIETDQLRGNLVTVVGSLDGAGAAFENLTKFAAKTPFTLDQSVNAFIKLKALGLDPSERALTSYGNTASAMGKDMAQMIEAVADASTNEFERLKEFGIKAKQQGDNVTFTFQGVSTTVAKESKAIQEYLLDIGETKFGDAMANQMDRLPGKLSNLEDAVDGLFRTMADDGGTSAFGSAIGGATNVVELLAENIDKLYGGAQILALILGGRLAASASVSGRAFLVSTAEALRYEATLASLAGVSRTAALAQTGLGVATRGAGAAMALVGGPVGVAVLAAGAMYMFREELGFVSQSAEDAIAMLNRLTDSHEELKSATEETSEETANLTVVQAAYIRMQLENNYTKQQEKLADLTSELRAYENLIANGTSSKTLTGQMLEIANEIDTTRQVLELYDRKLQQMDFVGPLRDIAPAVGVQTEATNKYIESLKLEIERIGMAERAVYLLEAADKAGADASDAARAEAVRLAAVLYEKKEALDDATEAAKDAKKTEDELRKTLEKQSDQVVTLISDYRNKIAMVGKAEREQYIYNETLKIGEGVTLQVRMAAIALAATYYDMAEAARISAAAEEKASKDREKAAEDEAKRLADNWQRTHEFITNSLIELGGNGKNFWEDLGEISSKTLKRIVAEWAASGLMGMFTGQGTSGFTMDAFNLATGNGGGGGVGLGNLSSMAGMAGTAGQFVGGMFGNSAVAGSASFVGPMAPGLSAGGMGSTIGALASNPATWAVAALAIAAKNDFWKDPDDYKRSYAGFLTAPTAGAAGSTFDIDPFASGFRAQGIAHNTDQTTANQYIDTFRSMDASITALVASLGGRVDLSGATLDGVGKEGQLGTNGTFLGMGGKTTEQDIAGMVNLYVSQMAKHITGLDEDLLSAVQSASSAEEAVRLLSDAMAEEEVELTNMEKARLSASQQILNAYESGITELDSIERAYEAFQGAAKRGLTAAMISQSTGIMESEIQRVLDAGAALGGGGAANDPARNVFGSDLWTETARQAWQPDAEFKAALNAVGINTNTGSEIDGSHFNGLDFVPFDGYRAELHRGERVQTASEARASDSNGQDMASMMVAMNKMVQFTKSTNDILLNVTRGGNAMITEAA